MRHRPLLIGTALLLAGCMGWSPMDAGVPSGELPTLLSIVPANTTVGVDPNGPVVLTFSRPMMPGMKGLIEVHEGTLAGVVVPGEIAWSPDRTTLTFTPETPLKARTTYVVHLSPGLMGANGLAIDFGGCLALGGRYATVQMFGNGGRMMSGQRNPGMMGSGWAARDGTFGMWFTFTTA